MALPLLACGCMDFLRAVGLAHSTKPAVVEARGKRILIVPFTWQEREQGPGGPGRILANRIEARLLEHGGEEGVLAVPVSEAARAIRKRKAPELKKAVARAREAFQKMRRESPALEPILTDLEVYEKTERASELDRTVRSLQVLAEQPSASAPLRVTVAELAAARDAFPEIDWREFGEGFKADLVVRGDILEYSTHHPSAIGLLVKGRMRVRVAVLDLSEGGAEIALPEPEFAIDWPRTEFHNNNITADETDIQERLLGEAGRRIAELFYEHMEEGDPDTWTPPP